MCEGGEKDARVMPVASRDRRMIRGDCFVLFLCYFCCWDRDLCPFFPCESNLSFQ